MTDDKLPTALPDNPKGVQVALDVRGLAPRNMDELARFALAVHRSGLAPKGMDKPEAIMVVVQTGMEAGLSPMAALRALYLVPGSMKPAWYVEAALGLIRASGKAKFIRFGVRGGEGEKMEGWCETQRIDMAEPVERTFSWADAKRAGLTAKDNYRQYPQRMLQWRAVGFVAHDFYSEVLMGLGIREEVIDVVAAAREDIPRERPTRPDPLLSGGGTAAGGDPEVPVSPSSPPAASPEIDPETGETIPLDLPR